ncbi:MAG TPA: helix-hairpin-helix domain-containing protein [Phycisphaerae bacterium]|nr:helix-hairpin-helix domain-containing protein [Phycisphaerae bacterium]
MSTAGGQPAQEHDRARQVRRVAVGVAALVLILHLGSVSVPPGGDESPIARPEIVQLRLDPNVATRDELMLLPGIGPKLAQYIIEYRTAAPSAPAFATAEDLDNVARIGPVTVEKLRPYLCFPATAARPEEDGS